MKENAILSRRVKGLVKGQGESTLFEFEMQTRVSVKSFLLLLKEYDVLIHERLYFDVDVDLMRIFPFSSIEI